MHKVGSLLTKALLVSVVLVLAGVGGAAMGKPSSTSQLAIGMLLVAVAVGLAMLGVRSLFDENRRKEALQATLVGLVMSCVMTAIFSPVFFSARSAQPRSECVANLKKLALATQVYLADSNDTLPPADRWSEALITYVRWIPRCPDAKSKVSYGMNTALGGLRLDQVSDPSATVLFFELESDDANAHGTAKDVVVRHGAVSFVATADGAHRGSSAEGLTWTP